MTPVPGGQFVLIEARTKFSRLFTGVVLTVKDGGVLPGYVKAGDTRGHEAEGTIGASYEALLAAAEGGKERSKDWRPWEVVHPCTLTGRVTT